MYAVTNSALKISCGYNQGWLKKKKKKKKEMTSSDLKVFLMESLEAKSEDKKLLTVPSFL